MPNPKSKQKILISYDPKDDIWYPATVLVEMSTQFSAMWGEKGERHGYFFYKDEGVTWKPKELQQRERK